MAKTATTKKGAATKAAPAEQVEKDSAAPAAESTSPPDADVPAADAADAPVAADPAAAETETTAPAEVADVDGDATDAEGNAPAAGGDAEVDALNTAAAVEALAGVDPEAAAEVADVGVDTAATLADGEPATLAFPLRVRVTNNTRMPVQLAVVALDLPAADSKTITVAGQREFDAMQADLQCLRNLNGFPEDAFEVEPLSEDDE